MKCRVAAVSANRAHVIRRYYTIRARICKGEERKFSESSHFVWRGSQGKDLMFFRFGFVELFVLHLSVHGDRKVPKERHQRAERPLDARFSYMGLFDRGYTRRGIQKALRKSLRRRFSHAPPNSTPSRCAAIVAVAASPLRRARSAIRQTPSLPAEKKGEFRADGAPPSVRVFGSWRLYARSDSFAVWRKSRADQEDGYLRKKPWVSSLSGVLSVAFCRHGQKAT